MSKTQVKNDSTYTIFYSSLSESIVKAMKKYHFKLYVTHCLDTEHYVDFKAMINDHATSISNPKYHITDKEPFVYESLKFTLEGDILGRHQKLTNLDDYDVVLAIKKWIVIKQANEYLDHAIKIGQSFYDKPEVSGNITIPVCSFGTDIKFYIWVDQTMDTLYFKKDTSKGNDKYYRTVFDYQLALISTADEECNSFLPSDNRPILPNEAQLKDKSQKKLAKPDEKLNSNSLAERKNEEVVKDSSKSKRALTQQISLF